MGKVDPSELTVEELKALLIMKDEENHPTKEGFLKEDLYDSPQDRDVLDVIRLRDWLVTKKQLAEILEEIRESFPLAVPKGTRFVCFNINGGENWFDDVNHGIEHMDENWANEYLENIKLI